MAGSGNNLPCVTIWQWLYMNCGRAPILRILFAALVAFTLLRPASASPPSSGVRRRPTIRYFIATAYSVEGTGASGKWSHPGTVAADRKVLPLNSRIRVYGAGRYSGDYTVEDTGGKVDGHHIDVYMPSQADAKKFGRQRVRVVVLKYGDDEVSPPDPQQRLRPRPRTEECALPRIESRPATVQQMNTPARSPA